MEQTIPYKIYLEEQEMPKQWYNVRADMKKKPAPILNPQTLKPVTVDELSAIFCTELAKQELDDTTPYFDIPQEIRDFYKMYRPSPLVRAYCLEKKLGRPAHIYYKFEGNAPAYLQQELKACADVVNMLDVKMFSLNQAILELAEAQRTQDQEMPDDEEVAEEELP